MHNINGVRKFTAIILEVEKVSNLFNDESKLVSAVIHTYNYGKFIADTLDGLKKQTYRNIEVIIIDDCSTDDTGEIVKNWRENNLDCFQDFIYLKLPRNCEGEWASNIGYSLAKGEYISINTSDDISHEEKIEKQIKFLKENPEVDVVGTKYEVFVDDINNTSYVSDWLLFDSDEIEKVYKESFEHCVVVGTLLFKRSTLSNLIGYRKITYGANDMMFAKNFVKNGFTVNNIDETLYYLRDHSDQKSKYMRDKAVVEKKTKKIEDRVSIVLPVYEENKSLSTSLEGVFNQSYNNMELIIIDNTLSDYTENLVKDICLQYKGEGLSNIKEVVYLKLPRKIEKYWIYNIGAYLSKGEFIAFQGIYGISYEDRIQKQFIFLKNNKYYSAVGTNFKGDNKGIEYGEKIKVDINFSEAYKPSVNMDTLMLSAKVIDRTAGINPYWADKGNFEFLYKLVYEGYKIENLNDILYEEYNSEPILVQSGRPLWESCLEKEKKD